ncbi:hypothetical protein ACFFX1_40265 [Dactylosporangium sucinum]|nr:hypothetical protein [Dactylosporangium sucinum]
MTSGNEQRRKRRSDSFRRDEADEADNWLAGLRGSGRGEPDPFAAPPPPEPAPFEHPAFDAPPRGGRRRPREDADDSPSGVFSPAMLPPAPPPSRPPAIDPTQAMGRRRRDDSGESPSGSFRSAPPADPGSFRQPPAAPDTFRQAPDAFRQPPAAPDAFRQAPAAPDTFRQPPAAPDAFRQPPAAEPGSGGRRRAREIEPAGRPSESYDHGPELTPIIKPLADYTPAQPSTEPPPLVPIFPSMRPDASPTTGVPSGRRGRRAAEEADEPGGRRPARDQEPGGRRRAREDAGGRFAEPATGDVGRRFPEPATGDVARRFGEPATGDVGRRLGEPSTGDVGRRFGEPATGDVGGRRRRDGTGEFPGEFGGPRGRADETTAFRRQRPGEFGDPRRPGDFDGPSTGNGHRGRTASAGFAASAPPEVDAPRRRPSFESFDDPPHQRRALDDAMPGRGHDDPSGARRRGTGEFTGSGARALRERPGGPGGPGRPPGRPGRGGTGSHPRAAVIESGRPEHRPHRWVALLSAVAVLVVLAACGIGTWFIFRDERDGPESARSSTTAGPKKRDISSRKVDPNPLTEAEVFPSNNIVAAPNEPPYVILSTKASPDCKTAATDDLAALLMNAGCSEVVRATMKSPNEEYLITAGLFNLDTEEAAAKAFDSVKPIVDGQKGRFSGMSVGAGTGTDALVRAPTQLGWNYKGHFIAYCVIARVDGNAFAPDDPYPNQITFDIVETYLENGIIGNRAIIQPDATPAASLPAAPGSQPPAS